MVTNKSLDEVEIIAALLRSIHMLHGDVFNHKALKNTTKVVRSRASSEGVSFLTKALPRLGKVFDKALAGIPFDPTHLKSDFALKNGSKLPMFMGEFIERVLNDDGTLRPDSCTNSVKVVRDVCYLFYKYKLPYSPEQERKVITQFEETEQSLTTISTELASLGEEIRTLEKTLLEPSSRLEPHKVCDKTRVSLIRDARRLLYELFRDFDPTNITPRHGPGAVATRQKLWEKFQWTNVSESITDLYPLDSYFYASSGHVCDAYRTMSAIGNASLPARVILVPKDSRGPRLISCEPVDYQWVQQGLGRAIVRLVESHSLTRHNVNFTNQQPNMYGALLGSEHGGYATLDLNEASDRVSLELVRLLFPSKVLPYLEACRSSSTTLPDGRVLKLNKFAPMGSALCFPILSLVVWSLLSAQCNDTDTRESILVYGDDVIVPTAYAENAIERLESFGLKVNRDKSCTGGFFRESCGMDAFKGSCVTPVRIRTTWSSEPSPSVYSSWISYANSFYERRYFDVYEKIVESLHRVYGAIPDKAQVGKRAPALIEVSEAMRPKRKRSNKGLQRLEWHVLVVKSPVIRKVIDGWLMLLRYFTEVPETAVSDPTEFREDLESHGLEDFVSSNFSASQYTSRKTSLLVRRWR